MLSGSKTTWLRVVRLLLGLLAFSALVTEIVVLLERGTFNAVNFFSYFTVLSNIAAASYFIWSASLAGKKETPQASYVRGAVTLYMAMTGVIFSWLLAGLEGVQLTAVPWDNTVLHYIIPVTIVLDWLLFPPKSKLPYRLILIWLSFPILYITYSLIRGALVGWYPYPFLNAGLNGYSRVFVTILVLLPSVTILAWGLIAVSNRQKST